jgi:N-glycosylase/DNA lyase
MADEINPRPATIRLPAGALNLQFTLTNGQMFRWRKGGDGWWDAVRARQVLRIRPVEQSDGFDVFEYVTYPGEPDERWLRAFLRLDVDLARLASTWDDEDPHLAGLARRFAGLRLVAQDPEECLLSFICSTANFIPRIMKAVSLLANRYGEPINGPDGAIVTHSFPRASVLASQDPFELDRLTGLEWRAGNLVKVASQLTAHEEGWLLSVASLDYAQARGELMRIDGVGPKIADCVCLFAMQKDQAVPVDTHVWQLTRDRYLPHLKGKSLTPAAYSQVLQFYQTHFTKAGWAQQYLFFEHLLESREKRRGGGQT